MDRLQHRLKGLDGLGRPDQGLYGLNGTDHEPPGQTPGSRLGAQARWKKQGPEYHSSRFANINLNALAAEMNYHFP